MIYIFTVHCEYQYMCVLAVIWFLRWPKMLTALFNAVALKEYGYGS